MIKKICFIGILLFACCLTQAQNFWEIKDKPFNFGGKVGFNATFPIINSLTIDGTEVDNIHLQYKVGYLAALFCRVNMNRFFLQPSIAWYRADGKIYFNMPTGDTDQKRALVYNSSPDYMEIRTHSLEIPVMVGYHLVKQGPYGLSLMLGPKMKYNYKIAYTTSISNNYQRFESDNTPFGINIAAGVGVSIWRLFLDFIYEFGLNQVESDFKYNPSQVPVSSHEIRIDKRTNVMSFSLGFMF